MHYSYPINSARGAGQKKKKKKGKNTETQTCRCDPNRHLEVRKWTMVKHYKGKERTYKVDKIFSESYYMHYSSSISSKNSHAVHTTII